MERNISPRLEHVLGDTWCIVTGSYRIPLYMPDRDNAVMIDSGLKRPDREGLLALLEQEKIRVSALLTSHFHRDHVGNHRVIKEIHGAHVYMTPFASAVCSNPGNQTASTYESFLLAAIRGGPFESPTDHIFLPSDPQLTAAGHTFRLLPLPGHAQEHTGFVTPDGVAYLGDTLLTRQILQKIRIPYCVSCREDLAAKEAVKSLDYPCYILAHNGVCTELGELAQENIDNLHAKLRKVEELASRYITLEQLAARYLLESGGDGNVVGKVTGTKRNVQVLVEYLQESGRLDIRARDGFLEYIRT